MKRIGFGQVEPNHLSAKRNGKIYAQLPAASHIEVLENGMFAKYDYEANEVNFTGDGEWMLVLNEVKLYDADWRYQNIVGKKSTSGVYSGYAMKKGDFMDGVMVPRLFKTDIGDIFTTNCIKGTESAEGTEVNLGAYLVVGKDGYLAVSEAPQVEDLSGMVWKVVKVYTMPDGQEGVKLQRVQ